MQDSSLGEKPLPVAIGHESLPAALVTVITDQLDEPESLLFGAYVAFIQCLDPNDRGKVRFTITADLVASVTWREQADNRHRPYDTERGAGIVAAKNMPMPDGTVDVLFQAFLFIPDPDLTPEEALVRTEMVRHTAIHEGVHAAQNLLELRPYEVYERQTFAMATRLYCSSAAYQISEHVAEVVANQNARPTTFEPREITDAFNLCFSRMGKQLLEQVADDPSGEKPGYFERGMQVTTAAVHNVWVLLAYLAASLRNPDSSFRQVDPEFSALPEWDLWVEPWWEQYLNLLQAVPIELAPDIESSDSIVSDLAILLQDWFAGLGIVMRDQGQGAYFRVADWSRITNT